MKALLFLFLLPALCTQAQSLDTRIKEAAMQLTCQPPDEENPVSMNAVLVKVGDSMAVMLKVAMAPGWHVYAYVPPGKPYIASELKLELPDHSKAIGEWVKPEPHAIATDPGVLIYEGKVVFVHKIFKLSGRDTDEKIRAGLYYQTCNLRQCLPPKEKMFALEF